MKHAPMRSPSSIRATNLGHLVACRALRPLAFALVLLFLPALARAQAAGPAKDLGPLLVNLKHEDFRVRTQAALALGASKDARASGPLCRTLADSSAPVRAAAAAALGRLANGGVACLEQRYAIETNPTVKAAIERAAELVFRGFRITADTRFYVAIATLADESGRPSGELPKLTRSSMLSAGRSLDSFAFAPAWENTALARQRLGSHSEVKAFYLSPRLSPFDYSDGSLTVRLEIAMFSYPEKSLIGSFNVRLTQPDVAAEDVQSERELVKMAAERAMQKFAKLVPTLL